MTIYLVIPASGPITEHDGNPIYEAAGHIGTDLMSIVTCGHPGLDGVYVLWIDDWGATNELPLNRRAWALYGRSPIFGTAVFCQDVGEDGRRPELDQETVDMVLDPDFPGPEINGAMDRFSQQDRPMTAPDPDCRLCHGYGTAYPEHIRGEIVALDTVPGYDPRVPCPCTKREVTP